MSSLPVPDSPTTSTLWSSLARRSSPGEEGSHGNARSEHLTEADLPTERDRLPRPRRHHLGTTPAKCDHGSHRTVPVEHARPVDVEAVFAPQISYANALLGQAHAKVTP